MSTFQEYRKTIQFQINHFLSPIFEICFAMAEETNWVRLAKYVRTVAITQFQSILLYFWSRGVRFGTVRALRMPRSRFGNVFRGQQHSCVSRDSRDGVTSQCRIPQADTLGNEPK